MKKAKNALAIIGIVLSGLATVALFLLPVLNFAGAMMSKTEFNLADKFSAHLNEVVDRVKELFNFSAIFNDIGAHMYQFIVLCVLAVGVILLLVLFVIMLCKKHAKGLGWWFPMLILFAAAGLVCGVGVAKEPTFLALNTEEIIFMEYKELSFIPLIVMIVAAVAAVLFILASIFYIVYVCGAGKENKEKQLEAARNDLIAKIDALLGGNK